MPRLDPKIIIYQLSLRHDVWPIKQPYHCFHPKLILQIENELNRLIEVEYIEEVKYPYRSLTLTM